MVALEGKQATITFSINAKTFRANVKSVKRCVQMPLGSGWMRSLPIRQDGWSVVGGVSARDHLGSDFFVAVIQVFEWFVAPDVLLRLYFASGN